MIPSSPSTTDERRRVLYLVFGILYCCLCIGAIVAIIVAATSHSDTDGGACCINGACAQVTSAAACTGTFLGVGTRCAQEMCPDGTTTTTTSSTTSSTGPAPTPTASTSCCPQDEFVTIGTMFAGTAPNLCGSFDYNCDGTVEAIACCAGHPMPDPQNNRVVWKIDTNAHCNRLERNGTTCGACSARDLFRGWSCRHQHTRKRFQPECPTTCNGTVMASPDTFPSVGECANTVTECVDDRGGESVECCQLVYV